MRGREGHLAACPQLPRRSVAAWDDTWRIEMKCAFPGPRQLRVAVLVYESVVAPEIDKTFETRYNATDVIKCTAEGYPEPTVTWIHVSGCMPADMGGVSGSGQAVLSNFQCGDHEWMCIANNSLGSDNVTVSFTGTF